MPANPTAPFTLIVLPARRESANLHLSAYIDLNRAYADMANFDTWYDVVRRFHRATSHPSLFDLLCARIENAGVRFRSETTGQGPTHGGKITSRPTVTAMEAWNEAFTPRSNRQPNRLPAPSVLAASGGTVPLVTAERPVSTVLDTTRAALTSMLTTGSMSGSRPLTASERAQIHMAAANQATVNHSRIAEALTNPAARQSLSNPNVSDSLDGLAAETLALRSLTREWFARSIEYMWRLFDLLTPSPDLRRVFGMTIDFSLADVSSVGGRTLVDLDLGNQPLDGSKTLADWFDAPPTILISLSADPRQTLVAEDDTKLVANGVLQLNASTRVVCFEPQSAAESAEQGARELTEHPDSDRAPQGVLSQSPTRWRTPNAHRALASIGRKVAEPTAAASNVRSNLTILRQERYRATLLSRTDKRVANTPTRGLVVYHTDPNELIAGIGVSQDTSVARLITAAGAIRGFVIYVRRVPRAARAMPGQTPSAWVPLTTISESLIWRKDGREEEGPFIDRELGIHIGGGVRADSAPAQGSVRPKTTDVIRDGFISSWDGTSLSLRSPLRHRDRGEGATAADEIREALLAFERSHDLNELETLAALMNVRDHLRVEWHPFPNIVSHHSRLTVRRKWANRGTKPTVALSFNREVDYQFIAVPQYHNGYFPVDEATINSHAELARAATPPAPFLRYDHIRDIVVAFDRDIYEDRERKVLRPENAGESERDLVVRTGESLDNDRSVRVLLPPSLPTFQTYLWYDRADLQAMGPARNRAADTGPRHSHAMNGGELATWYERYTCDARSAEDFDDNKQRAREKNRLAGAPIAAVRGCGAGCTSFCGGIAQPPIYRAELRYLPDPVVTGLRMEFFADADCAVPNADYPPQDCFFRNGGYPNLHGWRLVLEKASDRRPLVERDDRSQTLTVRLPEGHRVRVSATPMYRPEHSHFADSLLEAHGLTDAARIIRGGAHVSEGHLPDPLHANVMTFVLTHATQRPIATPTIADAIVRRFNPTRPATGGQEPPSAAMFELEVDVSMEWLNLVHGLPDPSVAPTGELELFGVWDDYDDRHDGPSTPLEAKIDESSPTRGFVRIARLSRADFTALSSHLADGPLMGADDVQKIRVTFRSGHAPFTAANHTRMRIRVRNSSQFYSFFHVSRKTQMSDQDLEWHSRWSNDLLLVPSTSPAYSSDAVTASFIANNLKPQQPEVVKIVALVTRDDQTRTRTAYRGNRVRIYLSPTGRQFTGPERIGILTATSAAGLGPLDGLLSKGGQDIVTDGPALPDVLPTDESWLRREHFVLGDELEPQYHELFEPRFESDVFRDVAPGVGVVSYRPRFDEDQQLWYIDIELDIPRSDRAELHNPMARLAVLTYQPYGANYGSSASVLDYRVSDVRPTQFFSIYPSRTVGSPRVLFGAGDGSGCILSAAVSSLYFKRLSDGTRVLRTQFVAEVQRRADGQAWETIPSLLSHLRTTAGGREVPRDVQHPPTLPSSRHLLLPEALPTGSPDSRFECEFRLEFDKRFFDVLRSERYRVLLQEIDWFPFVEQNGVGWSTLQSNFERHVPLQVPDVRVRQNMLLMAR